jgi:MoxR-like ATPase
VNAGQSVSERDVAAFHEDFTRLRAVLDGVLAGQGALVRDLLVAVLAGGHVLLEGPPGLGKTNLAKALARAIGVDLARIQCTPDLMPSDITGSEVLTGADGAREFEFRPGPVFASMVLVDEINRATPRSQSALLEAMQERQVTYAGTRHPLPNPFWVLATQNPIEFEGSYPLPEAQLDRFMTKLRVDYPARAALVELAARTLDAEPADSVELVLAPARLQQMMAQARAVVVSRDIVEAAAALVLATHPDGDGASAVARAHLRYGASPRALQALLRQARIHALADGRGHVCRDDLLAGALPVLRHRVLLGIDSELADVAADAVLVQILAEWTQRN